SRSILQLVARFPVPWRLVIIIDGLAELQSIIARELVYRAGRRRLQLLLRIIHDVGALRFVVLERGPWHWMVLFRHPEKSAETDDGKQDAVGLLIEHHILDLADFLAGWIGNLGAEDLFGADGRGVSAGGRHRRSPGNS